MVGRFLESVTRYVPEVAVIDDTGKYTCAQVGAMTAGMAEALRALGVGKGKNGRNRASGRRGVRGRVLRDADGGRGGGSGELSTRGKEDRARIERFRGAGGGFCGGSGQAAAGGRAGCGVDREARGDADARCRDLRAGRDGYLRRGGYEKARGAHVHIGVVGFGQGCATDAGQPQDRRRCGDCGGGVRARPQVPRRRAAVLRLRDDGDAARSDAVGVGCGVHRAVLAGGVPQRDPGARGEPDVRRAVDVSADLSSQGHHAGRPRGGLRDVHRWRAALDCGAGAVRIAVQGNAVSGIRADLDLPDSGAERARSQSRQQRGSPPSERGRSHRSRGRPHPPSSPAATARSKSAGPWSSPVTTTSPTPQPPHSPPTAISAPATSAASTTTAFC